MRDIRSPKAHIPATATPTGLGPHSLPEMLAKDRTRQNALQMWHPGVRIARFTWQDLKRSGYIASVLARAAGRS